jgi:LPXTG-motif cell wall-anchored protein
MSILRGVAVALMLAALPAMAQNQNDQGQNNNNQGQNNNNQGTTRSAPEFGVTAVGTVVVLLAGGGALLARRRRR